MKFKWNLRKVWKIAENWVKNWKNYENKKKKSLLNEWKNWMGKEYKKERLKWKKN